MNKQTRNCGPEELRDLPRLTRSRADQLLCRAVARIQDINTQPAVYYFRVDRLAVFGSYLTDVPLLGDLDLAADFEYLHATKADASEDHMKHWNRGLGRCIAYLRQRCRLVDVHGMQEVRERRYPHRVLFELPQAEGQTSSGSAPGTNPQGLTGERSHSLEPTGR